MTPIFTYLRKQIRLKPHKRRFDDSIGLLEKLASVHTLCFDVESIYGPIVDVLEDMREVGLRDYDYFALRTRLPADGVFLETKGVAFFVRRGAGADNLNVICCDKKGSFTQPAHLHADTFYLVAGALWLINTPNMVRLTNVEANRNHIRSAPRPWLDGEYKKVELCIDGRVVDVNYSNDRHGKMRRHYVKGYLRRAFNNRPDCTEYKWVDGHFKGNPEIGTVNKQYECTSHARCV